MKHSTKNMLRSALVLFVTGLLLTTCAYIYAAAKGVSIYSNDAQKAQYVSYTETFEEILSRSPDATKNSIDAEAYPFFNIIDITSQVGDIEIIETTEASRVEYTDVDVNNLSCLIVGDTLKISELRPVSFMGVSVKNDGIAFDGLRQIFNKKSAVNPSRKITLYINSSLNLQTVSVKTNVGDVSLDGLHASEISLNVAYGKAKVINTSVGSGTIKINGDIADVVFERNVYSMTNVSVIYGDISAIVISAKSNFEVTLGSVSVVTTDALEDYTVRMSTNYGKVKVDGEIRKETEYNQSGSSDYVWIKAGAGNISISSETVVVHNPSDGEETENPSTEPVIDAPEIPEIP